MMPGLSFAGSHSLRGRLLALVLAAIGLVTLLQVPGSIPGSLARATDAGPTVILFVGVNGVGKTTSIAKLAQRENDEGRRVVLAAADTSALRVIAVSGSALGGKLATDTADRFGPL